MLNFEHLLWPVLVLMGMAFVFSAILRSTRSPLFASISFGLLFGSATVLAMWMPIELREGLIFDLRGLLIGMSILFAGWMAGLVTLAIGIGYRIFLGGHGMMAGLVGMVLAYGIGWMWARFGDHRITFEPLSHAIFGAVSSLSFFGIFVLPFDIAKAIISQIYPVLFLTSILGAVGLGLILRREERYVRDAEQLRIYASIDPLTNLLNRRGAEARMQEIKGSTEEGQALFYFDLDHFKEINDTFGHAAGDAALAAVAGRIQSCVREHVVFSRHGGDEFTLFMPDVAPGAVDDIAERFCRIVRKRPVTFQGEDFRISISVGGFWTRRDAAQEEMLEQADTQLRLAKDKGRDCASVKCEMVPRPMKNQAWDIVTSAMR